MYQADWCVCHDKCLAWQDNHEEIRIQLILSSFLSRTGILLSSPCSWAEEWRCIWRGWGCRGTGGGHVAASSGGWEGPRVTEKQHVYVGVDSQQHSVQQI